MYLPVRDESTLYADWLAHTHRIEQHVALADQLFRALHIENRSGINL